MKVLSSGAVSLLMLGVALALPFGSQFDSTENRGFRVSFPNREGTKSPPISKANRIERPSVGKVEDKSPPPRVDGQLYDSVFDDIYKPWGAATLPQPASNSNSNQVVLDKLDEDLFPPTDSEIHNYDQQRYI